MTSDKRKKLSEIKQFKQLIAYLRDEMGWPIESDSKFDELTYEYTTTELGIDDKSAAQIQEIKRLRPLSAKQPWGVFFVKFEPKKLPVVALRRILGQVALKKRASANPVDRTMWAQEDLLFISNYGEGDNRQITLAHFSVPTGGQTLPSLKVLGWDSKDTVLHLEAVAQELTEQLSWPVDESDVDAWRAKWRAAFTVGHQEVITTSKALSIRLAQLARDIRDRISTALTIETEDGPLTKLMKAFQESLIHDLTPADFADMYAQTIAYGLLSTRIVDPKKKSVDDLAVHMRLSPFLQELMETFLQVGGRNKRTGLDFDELGVGEVTDLLDRSNMEAVVTDFGDKNPQEDPVIHFYELFLKEYDAKKRMARGVFYTPRPIVSYIIRSVHELLRTEFGLVDGMADTATWGEMSTRIRGLEIPAGVLPSDNFVQILDPATGTGTFLVEAIEIIHQTMREKWQKEGRSTAESLTLWNDYVPKHLLPRMHGYELLMAPYAIGHLKIALKLRETGYLFHGKERARVFLTNSLEPSQDVSDGFGFAIPALANEAIAVNSVKATSRFTVVIGNPPYSNFGRLNKNQFIASLLDDYKRDLNEHKINIEDDYIKFIRLSQFMVEKASLGITAMITNNSFFDGATHRKMRERLLHAYQDIRVLNLHGNMIKGETDENVFDIRVGVGVSFSIRKNQTKTIGSARYVSVLDAGIVTRGNKYQYLANSSTSTGDWTKLETAAPWFWFTPNVKIDHRYDSFWGLNDVFEIYSTGVKTKIDSIAVDFDRTKLGERVKDILDHQYPLHQIADKYGIKRSTTWEYDRAMKAEYKPELIQDYDYRPFDTRVVFYEDSFLSRSRSAVMSHFLDGHNIGLESGRLGFIAFVSRRISDEHFSGGTSYKFPLWVHEGQAGTVWGNEVRRHDNFTARFRDWIRATYGDSATPETILGYVYAILHSPHYRSEYLAQFSAGFPRIPFPSAARVLLEIAAIGNEIIALHLLESPSLANGGPVFSGDKATNIEKVTWANGSVWIDKAESIGFNGVPEDVWNFRVGGYQVCDKWLKDRKGRSLSDTDISIYRKIVKAIAGTIVLMQEVDRTIDVNGGWPGAFDSEEVKPL